LLWAGGADGVSHAGEFFTLDAVCSFPKPVGGDLPIHVGGSSAPAARRAGRRGDGFFPGGLLTPDERRRQFELARAAAMEAGRDSDALQYTRWGSIGMSEVDVERFAREGVTRLVVSPATADPVAQRAEMAAFAERFALVRPVGPVE
ncbi:LLM class flavin-dependent oxidoreductase, partial [Amycolatopsis sp. NPDC051114]